MKKWKEIVNRPLIDNTKMQIGVNRVGHYVSLWLLTPLMSICLLFLSSAWLFHLTRETLWASVFCGPALGIFAVLSYGYYVPKGYRYYFYVVCAMPAVLALLFTIGCVFKVIFLSS